MQEKYWEKLPRSTYSDGMRSAVAFTIVLFCVAAGSVSGLQPDASWDPFGREQGLSGSSVTGIVQDETGFLWFSTQSGLNRWDGYTMRIWQKEPFSKNTLSHNLIQTMYLDHGRTLWLGTYGGLDKFDTTTETFTPFRHKEGLLNSLSHDVVTRIYRDGRGTLWVGTLDGLNSLDEKTGTFRVYPFTAGSSEGLSGKTVRTLVEDAQGRLWVGSSGGLDLYDPVADKLVRSSQVFPGKPALTGSVMASLRLPGDPFLWLAVWGLGLVKFDPVSGSQQVYKLSDDRLFSLNRGEGGELHVGTWGGGLVVFHPQAGDSFTFRHDPLRSGSLAHDVIYGTFQDRGGLVWVATNGGGVSRYNPRRQQFQFVPTDGKVAVLHETADGSLWAGVYNGGVVKLDPRGGTTTWKRSDGNAASLSNDILNGVAEDGKGRLWWMTNLGVSLLDPKTSSVTRWSTDPLVPGALPDEVVNSLAIDRSGAYWFGTYRSGLIRRPEPGTPGPERRYSADPLKPSALPDNLVYFVTQDKEGRIWVGTNGGLALYRPATDDFRTWRYEADNPKSLPSNTVRSLLEDSQGRIWVATNGGGLSRLYPDTGALENYGLGEGLTNLSVYTVLEDDAGLLWITSANGLFSFRPESRTFRRYGIADGLTSVEFSSGAVRRRNGTLVFGGLQGILSLRPSRLLLASAQPTVVLTGIQVLGRARPVGTHLTLGWQENAVTFSFAALDFRNPAKNLYAYRLEGFDNDWVQAGTRHEATYTNLWPGRYHFLFRGADPSEVWSDSTQVVTLDVEAAPWASWYALTFYAALLVAMIYLVQRARLTRALGQKVSELETVRGQLEEANRRLDQLARLDGLTGIPNRRALDLWLADEWARALRQQQSMALLMMDIDDFKRYNDFYGHLEGDACLKAVAKAFADSLHRTTDFCARYGGEEFVILLHDTELEGARTVAARVLESIDELAIPHQMATAADHVTVSIGVSCLVPAADLSVADLLQKADQALYRAKALGRHRIETV